MTDFLPLSSNPTTTPVLLIDSRCSYADLHESAQQRFRAVCGLLHSLAAMSITQADGLDIQHISEAAYLLAEDGCDLARAAHQAAMREKRLR
ncbi:MULTISPECIES: hypothetical protein [Pseudomonas]|uniref:Short-chain dehydrogenase n=2 Tax=Pseudomonadaceae TaxID=135621 RepID=A0A0D0JPN2_9PSED|nr:MULTISPECIES: hypothetical protein [Pseudomonas]KIP97318.1 hypothetical protein RU08_18880 [Pseudomonas fulva]MCW2291021.1 hypothetical protein [Pseudomonas sp. BIGb0408]NYH74408.1 hypothetical protein [Pseudomonas flavescens]